MAESRQLRRLVAYNQWADERLLAAVAGVPAEELARPHEAYFGTIAANLQHIVGGQRMWLARRRGRRPGTTSSSPCRGARCSAHRAETGLLLEPLGHSPGDIDYSVYCFQHP